VIRALLAHGADPAVTTKTIDVAHELQMDRAASQLQRKILEASVPKGQKPTPSQVHAAIEAARELYATGKVPPPEPGEGRGGGGANPADGGPAPNSFNPEETHPPVSSKGGLTALLHASRQGYIDSAKALLDGGAKINQVSAGDAVTPLLMAVINGEFDMATFLIERGADVNIAQGSNGVTPLWAAVNAQGPPGTALPQPQALEPPKAAPPAR